ncbi:nuclear RNA export factor 1 [Drosophila nasuta]|uniref:nuclear RNA export factor 1 n=1 Tax=Drosophila nasuta TaxID=42062 RepID=UPI00295F3210|nr:nuclear RNA export factor 1 [Drosophila nasuta]
MNKENDAVNSSAQRPCSSKEATAKHTYRQYPYGRYAIPISPYGWYRILIYSHKSGYSNAEVLNKLRRVVAPRRLRIYYLQESGQLEEEQEQDRFATFTFYVDSFKLAAELQLRGHCPPVIGVRVDDEPPRIEVNDIYREKLRQVILSRYNAAKRRLNLSRFYADDQLRGEFCALQQFECLEAIIEIMAQEMPRLRHLLLDNNHLCILDGFRNIEKLFPRLKSISLQRNELKRLRELRVFEKLRKLEKLNVRRNPLPLNYEQHLVIMMPQLRKLNRRRATRWRRVITVRDTDSDSDVESVVMPKPSNLHRDQQPGIRKFVRRYLKAFDGDQRSSDMERFYHDNALLSLTLAKDQGSAAWTAPYATFDRQLLATRQAIHELFTAWPKTLHRAATMTLDLMLVQPKMLSVSITGTFMEKQQQQQQQRHYMRTFVLSRSHETDDFRIANELIHLDRGTRFIPNPSQRHLMTRLSSATRLKSRWCCQFLKDTNWDYQQALLAFQALLRRHQLPKKAFTGKCAVAQPKWRL